MDPEIDRREFLKRSAVVGGVAATSVGVGLADMAPAWGASRCRWGALADTSGSTDQITALRNLERMVGRRFDVTHWRGGWDVPLVNGFTRWAARRHPKQIISWFAWRSPGGSTFVGEVANGQHDRWIRTQARSLRNTGWSGYFCFHKEPEDDSSAADWRVAYDRVRHIFNDVGVTRFKDVACLMASTYRTGQAERWLPRRYDLLGVDGYNRNLCGGSSQWRSFTEVFGASRTFARRHRKKLYVIESGCVEGPTGAKARWFDDARVKIGNWPEIVGFSYNHASSGCNYYIDTSASSLRAFRRMGASRLFGG